MANRKGKHTKQFQSNQKKGTGDEIPKTDSNTEPFFMTDAMIISDGGQLLMVNYVDIGSSSKNWPSEVLVKGIEAQYSLAHCKSIRISSPHRFQDVGETLIRDDQEGRARNRKEERENKKYTEERKEQEQALHQLGMTHVTLGKQTSTNSHSNSESYTFGGGSWIFCTAIQPTTEDEWTKLRRALPKSYNEYTTIHQPRKFAQTLGLMFLDQIGPNGKQGTFSHKGMATKPLVTLHDSQMIIHGPVLYTDDVYGFLDAHQDPALKNIFPLFVKDKNFQDQREYRFVLLGNDDVNNQFKDLFVSGMMRDALLPIENKSIVKFESVSEDQKKGGSISTTSKRLTKGENQEWKRKEIQIKTLKINGEVRQIEELIRETIVSKLSQSVISSDEVPDLNIGDERHSGSIHERQRKTVKIDGVPVEQSREENVKVGYIENMEDIEGFFTLEDKEEAKKVFEHARSLGQHALDSPQLRNTVSQLFGITYDPTNKKSVEITSAAWHGLSALANLHNHFGDIVENVHIENDNFISICLKPSLEFQANGRLLVGPLGTYAYVLRKGDEFTDGLGGEESRLVLFPDEEDAEKFSEYGWRPMEVVMEGYGGS